MFVVQAVSPRVAKRATLVRVAGILFWRMGSMRTHSHDQRRWGNPFLWTRIMLAVKELHVSRMAHGTRHAAPRKFACK